MQLAECSKQICWIWGIQDKIVLIRFCSLEFSQSKLHVAHYAFLLQEKQGLLDAKKAQSVTGVPVMISFT